MKGIPVEDGLAYALLTHESQLIFVAIIGAISFFIIFKKDRKKKSPDLFIYLFIIYLVYLVLVSWWQKNKSLPPRKRRSIHKRNA